MTYETQPQNLPHARIRLTLALWRDFLQFEALMASQGIHDGLYLFGELRKKEAFYFTAFLPSKVLNSGKATTQGYEGDQ